MLVLFGIYVRSIPPKAPKTTPAMTPEDTQRFLEEAMKDGKLKMTPEYDVREEGIHGKPPTAEAPDLSNINTDVDGDTTDETDTNSEDHVEL
jgi:hypothetical protein